MHNRPQPYNPAAKPEPELTVVDFIRHSDDPLGGRHRPGAVPLVGWLRRRIAAGLYFPPLTNAEAFHDYVATRCASPMMVQAANDVWRTYVKFKRRSEQTGAPS